MIYIKRFIKDVKKQGEFEGCRFKQLDGKYYLVFAWYDVDNDGCYHLCGKIATNSDDLQCDYDWDWGLPFNEQTKEVVDTEALCCEEETAEDLEKIFKDYYKCVRGL